MAVCFRGGAQEGGWWRVSLGAQSVALHPRPPQRAGEDVPRVLSVPHPCKASSHSAQCEFEGSKGSRSDGRENILDSGITILKT